MKQGHHRVNTNQTATSNKKSSKSKMQSNSNKNADNIHSQSFELPKIHRGSNVDTTSNKSYDLSYTLQQKSPLYNAHKLSEIEQSDKQQTSGMIDYQRMTMQQIKREYERLRKEFNILNFQIRKSQETLLSRVSNKKSRVSSTTQTQKLLAKTQQQVYQNSLLLQRLKLQYEQLDKRTNLANSNISKPNAELNEKLLKVKQKVLNAKDKIKLLKKKTKKSGEEIMNGEDLHELMEKLQKENKNYELKVSNLEAKLQESKFKIERQDQKQSQIQKTYIQAQDYLKLFKLQNEQQVERGIVQKQYQQLKYKHQVIRKKIESDQQVNLQKYHQLLKLFETESEKEEALNKRLIQEDVNILKARNVVLELEQELQGLQQIMNRIKEQQSMKRQAQLLKKAIQQGTHMGDTNNMTHPAIVQQNESQLNDTIEAGQNIKQDEGDKETVRLKSNKIRHIGKEQQMFQAIKGYSNNNSVNMRVHSNDLITDSNSKNYMNPQKQPAKRRNDQFKGSISKNIISNNIKQQTSNSSNQVKSGRRIHSLIKTKQESYSSARLKQVDLNNRTTNDGSNVSVNMNIKSRDQGDNVRVPSIRELQERNSKMPSKNSYKDFRNNNNKSAITNNHNNNNTKQGYINYSTSQAKYNKNNQSEVSYNKNNSSEALNNNSDEFIQQLEQLNQQLMQDTPADHQQQPNSITQKQKTSPRVSPSTINHNSLSASQQSRIRKQQSRILKPQVLEQIDKTNIEYTKKIQQLKKQIHVAQITSNHHQANHNKEQNSQQQQQEQQQQQQQQDKIKSKEQIQNSKAEQQLQQNHEAIFGNNSNDQNSPNSQVQINQQQMPISDQDEDEDIENDIEQINKMVRNKLDQENRQLKKTNDQ